MARRSRWPQRTDDGPADWDAYCEHQDMLHGMLPMCDECRSHIEEDFTYEFNGYYICEDCLNKNHRKWTSDLIE